MIKHKRIGVIAALLMAAAVLLTAFAYINPSAFASISGTAAPPYAAAMDKTRVMEIQIIADEADWAGMLANATAEEYIPATIIISGRKLENVGIRPKGNSSLSTVASDSTTDRYSFKLEFDQYIAGQTWLGLDKLVINNMQGDASYVKEYLSYDLMSYAGVDAPLYAFANITVNGELWGFYLAVEALEDSYAKRVYGNAHGRLYKPESMGMRGEGRMNEFIQELDENTEIPQGNQPSRDAADRPGMRGNRGEGEGGFNREEVVIGGGMGGMGGMSAGGIALQYIDDEISSYSAIFDNAVLAATENDYRRVIEALEKLSNGEDLENTVDIEAVLKYFAAHTVVVNLDSYVSGMAHNYYLYEDDGQLTILPWDYNLAFGGFQSGDASSIVNFPIDTPVSGVSLEDRPLLGKLLEVPEYAELYHSYLQNIVDGYFNSGLFEQTIQAVDALISSYVQADPTAFYEYDAYRAAVTEITKLGLLRAESIKGQLSGSIPSTSAEQSADASALVDASSVNLNALGSMGGGNFVIGGEGGFGGNMDFAVLDMETMQKAMEILQSVDGEELTEEQQAALKELGLTEEQIILLITMTSTFGGKGGNFPHGGDMSGMTPPLERPQDNATSAPPESAQEDDISAPLEQTPAPRNEAASPDSSTGSWLLFGGCTAVLLGGVIFAMLFKRRV